MTGSRINLMMKKWKPPAENSSSRKAPRLTAWAWGLRGVFFAACIVMSLAVILFEYEPQAEGTSFRIGEPAPRTLFSPFTITYNNDQKTEELRRQAIASVPEVFVVDRNTDKAVTAQVDNFFQRLHEAKAAGTGKQPAKADELSSALAPSTLAYLGQEPVLEEARKGVQFLFERSFLPGLFTAEDRNRLSHEGTQKITLVNQGDKTSAESLVYTGALRDADEIRASAGMLLPETAVKKRDLRQAVLEIFAAVVRPNIIRDSAETENRRKKALENVVPVQETIHKNELVIQRGVLVTAKEKRKIDLIQKKREETQILKKWSATAILVFLTHLMFIGFLLCFERRVLHSWRNMLLFQTVFLVSLAICKVISEWPGSSPFLMPGALAPLLLALLAGPRLGLSATFVMTGLLAPLGGFSNEIILTVLFSGIAGTLSSFKLRKRIEFLRVGLAVGAVSFTILFLWALYNDLSALDAAQRGALGFINGLLVTTPCLFLLLALFEAAFNLATDVTLVELSDLNHPLLKRMIIEAPGTYHHSLVVSRLAEGACEEIGANALLARVGCYFHDIGKMAQSHYFTENQLGKYPSKHEKLTPNMSSMIIINHVKDGIDLGRKYKLKQSVLRFIPEHQGTGIVYFFYRKALDQAAPGEIVNPGNYRYPGPNPQSKETAVAMIADSVEAASRSVREPTPEGLGALVRKIINDKFTDGQLDDCDLTLKDLHKIQESFVRNLLAIFHTRVPYPEKPEDPEKLDLFAQIGHEKPPVRTR